jgi:hypothetical protein
MIIDIKKEFDSSEPMSCQAIGCSEELNGLNHYTIEPVNGFILEMWLCDKCSKKFDKRFLKCLIG